MSNGLTVGLFTRVTSIHSAPTNCGEINTFSFSAPWSSFTSSVKGMLEEVVVSLQGSTSVSESESTLVSMEQLKLQLYMFALIQQQM